MDPVCDRCCHELGYTEEHEDGAAQQAELCWRDTQVTHQRHRDNAEDRFVSPADHHQDQQHDCDGPAVSVAFACGPVGWVRGIERRERIHLDFFRID